MDEPIITTCPLTNPEAIYDIAELRRELHLANRRLLEVSLKNHKAMVAAARMRDSLGPILQGWVSRDCDSLIAALKQAAERHVKVRGTPAATGRAH